MKKRMLSLMLAVLMVVCLLPTTALAATAGHTAADAIAWAQSQVGKSLDYDGVYGAQCVDLICCYYQYLGQRSPGGNGCDYATNRLPDGWQRIKGAQPQPGDILVYSGNSENPYGHVGIYESDYCTYNQNFNYEQYVQRVTIRYNHFSNPYWGVIRPDFSTAPLTATWEGPTAANITETGAHIISRVTFPQKVVFAQAGIRVYDESGKMVGTRDELDPITSPYLKFDYDINSELGISLQSGKKYSSSLYVIVNGKEYWSQPVTFTTAHTHYYTATVTAPTCTAKGYTTHTCACGDSYVDTYTDALGHAWDNGKVTKQPTETETGTKTFTCTRCGETKTETIPKLTHEHNYNAVVTAPTCTEKGYTTHTCACGDSYVDTYVDALGHAWDNGKVTKEPTETKTGVKTFTCTRCGETKTETIPVTNCPSAVFTDVQGGDHWAHEGIDYCIANGLMSGIGNDLFGPKLTTTRAQIVQILYNLEGEPKVSGTTPFTDLTNDWYQDAIHWAYQTGVVAGTSSTTFEPDLPVTREQIAVILMEYVTRVLKLERTWTPADLSIFPDADSVSDWAKDAMADAVGLGLISGASNGGQTYLEPQGSATREQVATILMEFCKNVKK